MPIERATTHDSRMRMLFLPADSIDAGISRCCCLAKTLATYADVFYVRWYDPRSAAWRGESETAWNTAMSVARSLMQRSRIEKNAILGFSEVWKSVLLDAAWGKLVGPVRAAQAKYAYNGRALQRLVREIRPDVVIHADGSCFFPVVVGDYVVVWDLQDAVKLSDLSPAMHAHWKSRFLADLPHVDLPYAVSQQAAEGLERQIGAAFGIQELPNGADFEGIRGIPDEVIASRRDAAGLKGKYVVSYVGGELKFDAKFAKRLFERAAERMPDAHFVVVGNVPSWSAANATFVGAVPAAEAAIHFRMCDLGVLPKDCRGDDFLYQSAPLKFVQYAAARKPVITFPFGWSEERQLASIFSQSTDDVDRWCDAMASIRREFVWNGACDEQWAGYSWDAVAQRLLRDIMAKRAERAPR